MDTPPDRPLPPRPAVAQSISSMAVGWLRWFGVGRLIATAVATVAVAGGGFWLLRTPPTPVESTLPYATATSVPGAVAGMDAIVGPVSSSVSDPTTSMSIVPADIIVYVAGAVVVPGVYSLPPDARVQQAVVAAGGMTPDADGESINLAGFLSDGARVYVPRVGVPVPSVVTPSGGGAVVGATGEDDPTLASGPIDLNTATAEQLDELPGIGPSTASAIVQHRETNGPYSTIDDLLDVRGIGPAKLDAIRELITV